MKPISRYDHTDRFEILDLLAWFAFKSPTSISFYLGRGSIDGVGLTGIGSVDVHYPCVGHIKVIFRFMLPERYHEFKTMKELVRLLLAKLQIPADETYEAYFSSPQKQASIENAVDRDGLTDRIY